MADGIDLNTRTDAAVVANGNTVAVEKDTVHVDFHVIPDVDVLAVINEKGSRYPYVLTPTAYQFVEDCAERRSVAAVRGIIPLLEAFGEMPALLQFFVSAVIYLACKHFFPFCHCQICFSVVTLLSVPLANIA
jgi:hypothetical protein